ncbi:MAG TPA: hypothetical protein VGO59_20460 [Verrucomicrobiae bacterium]
MAILLVILLAVAAAAYLQLAGMPDFLKNPLLGALRQRGFEAQFASARIGWGPSIVIENASFSPTNQAAGPRLTAEWTELNLNAKACLRFRLRIDSFDVQRATLTLPVAPTNQEPLSLRDVSLRVILDTNNAALMKDCRAWFRGINIHINGEIRDFMAARNWKIPLRSSASAAAAAAASAVKPAHPPPARLTAWDIFQKFRFPGAPQLNINFYGEGRDSNTLRADLEFSADGAQSPWGHAGPLRLRAACAHLFDFGSEPFLQARLNARDAVTPWGGSRALAASVNLSRQAGTNYSVSAHIDSQEMNTAWNSSAGSNWVRAARLQWDGVTALRSPGFVPDDFHGTLRLAKTQSGWGSADSASLVLQTRRADSSAADPAWGAWNQAKPFNLDWQAAATNITTSRLKLDRVDFKGSWRPPQLNIDSLEAFMYRGRLDAGGTLDVATREARVHAAADFDPHQISPLLTKNAQRWITLYDWKTPPSLSAGLRFVLPPWTNQAGAWPAESRDSLQLAGQFAVQEGAFRGIAVNSAEARFNYTNRVWNVSGLRLNVNGSWLDLDYTWSEIAHDYHFRFDSKLDPALAMPLLTPAQKRVMREWDFADKPELKGDAWGNWLTPETTGIAAALSTGRFAVRGENVEQLKAQLDYTNRFLRVTDLKLVHPSGQVSVPVAGIDFASGVISMSNATSAIDPEPVRRALGKIAPSFLSAVHFDTPPHVQASGSFRPGDDDGTDMHFAVKGDHFHWDHIHADSIQGTVDYHIRTVNVTNVAAGLYKNGNLQGWIGFKWNPHGDTQCDSDFNLKDLNLASLAHDWDAHSKLEGSLDGHLVLNAPFDTRETNFFGHGWLHLHDGLLWDIKLFGVFSPVLNAIAPGSGNSRARDARASFMITNGVLFTDDLEIRSSGFRLLYRGTLDTEARLNAHVEAKLLRDTPLFGHFFSWMLIPLDKLFEYRVTGTLKKPVAEPLYIPKVLTEILRPFHTLKKSMNSQPPAAPSPPSH